MKKNNSRISCRRGFTIIELLITASLIVLLSTAVFSVFVRGLDVWKRVKSIDRTEDEMRFSLEKFSRELRTLVNFKPIVFAGTKDRITFPTYLRLRDGEGRSIDHLGKVTYLYSPEERILFRRQEGYSDLFHPDRAVFEKFIAPVEEAVFDYYAFNPAKRKYEWKEKWSEPSRPAGIRLTLTILDHENKKKHIVTTVFPR